MRCLPHITHVRAILITTPSAANWQLGSLSCAESCAVASAVLCTLKRDTWGFNTDRLLPGSDKEEGQAAENPATQRTGTIELVIQYQFKMG